MQKQFNRRMGSEVGNGYINPFIVSAEQQVQMKYKCRLYGAYDSSEDFIYTLEVLEKRKNTILWSCIFKGRVVAWMLS